MLLAWIISVTPNGDPQHLPAWCSVDGSYQALCCLIVGSDRQFMRLNFSFVSQPFDVLRGLQPGIICKTDYILLLHECSCSGICHCYSSDLGQLLKNVCKRLKDEFRKLLKCLFNQKLCNIFPIQWKICDLPINPLTSKIFSILMFYTDLGGQGTFQCSMLLLCW